MKCWNFKNLGIWLIKTNSDIPDNNQAENLNQLVGYNNVKWHANVTTYMSNIIVSWVLKFGNSYNLFGWDNSYEKIWKNLTNISNVGVYRQTRTQIYDWTEIKHYFCRTITRSCNKTRRRWQLLKRLFWTKPYHCCLATQLQIFWKILPKLFDTQLVLYSIVALKPSLHIQAEAINSYKVSIKV